MTDPGSLDGPAHELVMPFVAVRSVGGPYDDLAYAAGWEMGALNRDLAGACRPTMSVMVRAANGAQAELVAMRHGYVAHQVPYDSYWTVLTLRYAPGGDLDDVPGRGPRHGRRGRRSPLD